MKNKFITTVAVASSVVFTGTVLAPLITNAYNPGYGTSTEIKKIKPKHVEYVINGDNIKITWDHGTRPAAFSTITFEYPKENKKVNIKADANGIISKKANNLKNGFIMTSVYDVDGSYLFTFNKHVVGNSMTPEKEKPKVKPEDKLSTIKNDDNKKNIEKNKVTEEDKNKKTEDKKNTETVINKTNYIIDDKGNAVTNGEIRFKHNQSGIVYSYPIDEKGLFDGALLKDFSSYKVEVYNSTLNLVEKYEILDINGNKLKNLNKNKENNIKSTFDPNKVIPAVPTENKKDDKKDNTLDKIVENKIEKQDNTKGVLPNTEIDYLMYISGITSVLSLILLLFKKKTYIED